MPQTLEDRKKRGRVITCASGDNRFWVVPQNMIGQLTDIEIDTHYLSGLTGVIQVQVRDSYNTSPTATQTSGTVIRKTLAVKAGDVVSVQLNGDFQLYGGVDVRVDFSGPIVSLAAIFN